MREAHTDEALIAEAKTLVPIMERCGDGGYTHGRIKAECLEAATLIRRLASRLATITPEREGEDGSSQTIPSSPSSGDTSAVAHWMMDHGYATGHGDTVEDMLGELEWQAVERGGRRSGAIDDNRG